MGSKEPTTATCEGSSSESESCAQDEIAASLEYVEAGLGGPKEDAGRVFMIAVRSWRYVSRAGPGRLEYRGGVNVTRLATRWIFCSVERAIVIDGIDGARTLSEVNGKVDKNSVSEERGNRLGSTGIVRMCMKISLKTFSYSGVDWGKVENGDKVSETRNGSEGEDALASMGYIASSDTVEGKRVPILTVCCTACSRWKYRSRLRR